MGVKIRRDISRTKPQTQRNKDKQKFSEKSHPPSPRGYGRGKEKKPIDNQRRRCGQKVVGITNPSFQENLTADRTGAPAAA
jgi:hypothetical protein